MLRRHRTLLLLLLLALGLRAYRLDFPGRSYFDEEYYVPASQDYLEGWPDENGVHPPFAKEQVAAGMLLMDGLKAYHLNSLNDTVGWRFSSCAAGVGTLVMSYLLGLALTGNRRTALLTVFLLTFDFLQLVQSRIVMLDQIQCFWITAGLAATAYALMPWLRRSQETPADPLAGEAHLLAEEARSRVEEAPARGPDQEAEESLSVEGAEKARFGAESATRAESAPQLSAQSESAGEAQPVAEETPNPVLRVTALLQGGPFEAVEHLGALHTLASRAGSDLATGPRLDWRLVWLAGLCFGGATACKWNGLFASFGAWLALVVVSSQLDKRPGLLRRLVLIGFTFLLVTAAVYLASYVPMFVREKSFGKTVFGEIWDDHKRMWEFRHDTTQFQHQYLSQFYQWPLVLRPIWYFYEEQNDNVQGIIALGSPVFWWFAAVVLVDLLLFSWRRRDRVGQFLIINYLVQWLLWRAAPIGGFFYYMLPVTPLMAVAVARELSLWWEQDSFSRGLAILYLAAVVALFVLYFPLLTGLSVSKRYYKLLFFYDGWS